ncbi:MAG: Gfo/Idh/MocA family oxidoreductase [Arachnia sp.]
MLKVGIVSLAHVHARSYAELLSGRPDVELRILEQDASLRSDVSDLTVCMSRAEDFWGWAPDAVIITSETVHHLRDVLAAAAAGAHILCEKPIATTRADARAIVEACGRAGVGLMMAFPVGFSPEAEIMRSAVEDGALGEVISAIGVNTGKLPATRDWFADPEMSGGGAIVDHVVHIAELLDRLGLRAESVSAATTNVLQQERLRPGVESGALVTISYESGVTASIDASWSEPDGSPLWGGLSLEIVGSAANLAINPFGRTVNGMGGSGPVAFGYGPDLDDLMISAFLASVRGSRDFTPGGDVGLRTLAIVHAAQESARTGQPASVVA